MTTATPHHHAEVRITIGSETRRVSAPAGATVVTQLKIELDVPATDTLFETHPGPRRPLGEEEVVDVKSGDAFEAIGGGGVS